MYATMHVNPDTGAMHLTFVQLISTIAGEAHSN